RSIPRSRDRDPDHERPSFGSCGGGGGARDPGNLPQERRIDAGCHPRRLRPLRGNRLLFAKPGGGSRGAAEADLMVREAVWVPNDAVRLVRLQRDVEAFGGRRFERFWSHDIEGCYVPEILWNLAGRPHGVTVEGVRDDNRSALRPDRRWVIGNREFAAAVKGCGAEGDAIDACERSGRVARPGDVWRRRGSRVRNGPHGVLRGGGTLPREHGPVLGCGAHPIPAELAAR